MVLEFRSVIDEMLAAPNRPAGATPPPIRLSQNEMPWGPSEPILHAMSAAARSAHRYPDYHRTAARTAVAQSMGIDTERIAIDNGSGSLLHGLARLVCEPGVDGVYCWPSFEAYSAALGLAGAERTPVDLAEDGAMDMPAMLAAIGPATRIAYLCNPNNPTGGFVGVEAIRSFLREVPANVLVVLDEAYREFVTAEPFDATEALLDEFDNLVILRTLSKSHGLAGLRAGYAAAAPRVAEALRRTSVGFALNGIAEAAVIAAFGSEAQAIAAERIAVIVSERERMEVALRDAGVSFLPSQSNFLFVYGDALQLMERFAAQGVLARSFPASGGVRVTVGLPEENDAALAALR
ncbi:MULTISPECIES: histidinol-phosphate transaminase [unclassified Microbacterium]|uniref:pyridoxal phosphate-dependent aminotransferase n=1 Tax=unclassified Microbacterium TaxID=2609290 RepID=UPI0012FBD58A|nr:aminotransferase class I/II-fold pyridoxal phosphate-dependent enzyme [Microbacterium sp. MAH-37]MVQ43390.1 aminotransferase class I/II-fold pyridoxal phosphate-dependent enzyme [Microbacterium sp. MAH-37]